MCVAGGTQTRNFRSGSALWVTLALSKKVPSQSLGVGPGRFKMSASVKLLPSSSQPPPGSAAG